MSAMAHLRTSDAGNTAPGSSALHIEDASTVTVEEKAKSTVTESSGSISVKTTGNDHGIRGERLLTSLDTVQWLIFL